MVNRIINSEVAAALFCDLETFNDQLRNPIRTVQRTRFRFAPGWQSLLSKRVAKQERIAADGFKIATLACRVEQRRIGDWVLATTGPGLETDGEQQ